VVVSAWEPWRTGDGAALVLHRQLQVLAPRHEIVLLAAGAPDPRTPPPDWVETELPGVEVAWYGRRRSAGLDRVGRMFWSARHREPAHVGFVARPALVAELRNAAKGADVVHLHGWGTAALWQPVAPVPTVHVALDSWSANDRNRRTSRLRGVGDVGQHRLVVRHERRHYPRLGAVVVVAERDATVVRELAPDARVEVIANGVVVPGETVLATERLVLGFHGVFDSQANVDAARNLVREVLPIVRRRVPAAQVLIAGRRPPREVRSLAGPGVEVVADAPDIGTELARMAVHVDWMTSGTGIKNKVLEAMAAGRPVVASPLGAEGIGEGPGLLVADSVAAAAETVVGLLNDPAAARETGRAGRERVIADFSWETNAARVEALWAELSR
jgi:glycosyltransferase involved in cell wall biosynthesis